MYTVEKQRGGWQQVASFGDMGDAIEWCLHHDNTRSGRVVFGQTVVWEDYQPIPQQAVSDQWGHVGYQAK